MDLVKVKDSWTDGLGFEWWERETELINEREHIQNEFIYLAYFFSI